MGRGLSLLVAAIALGSLPASAAYLQAGVDAARTGHSPDEGPEWPDVALALRLPGVRALSSPPLILGGSAYVLHWGGATDADALQSTMWRVDLASGEPSAFVEVPGLATTPVLHDGRLFLTRTTVEPGDLTTRTDVRVLVDAFDLATGGARWSVEVTPPDDHDTTAACLAAAAHAGRLYLACYDAAPAPARTYRDRYRPPEGTPPFGLFEIDRFEGFVVALRLEDGREEWRWTKSAAEETSKSPLPLPADAASQTSLRYASLPLGLSVNGPYVHVSTIEGPNPEGFGEGFVWTLRTDDGAFVRYDSSRSSYTDTDKQLDPARRGTDAEFINPAVPTGDGILAFLRLDRAILALNPAQGTIVWNMTVGQEDESAARLGSGFALVGRHLYASSVQTLYRVDLDTLESVQVTIPRQRGERWSPSHLVVAGGNVYGRTQVPDETITEGVFYAFDARTLEERWRFPASTSIGLGGSLSAITPIELEFGVGEGVMVVAAFDGNVTVLGRTAASPDPRAEVGSPYPEPGETVAVDLSRSGAGVGGPPTAYRADWGDGTLTDWQADPVLRHAYAEPGARTARFHVRNDAGQTASEAVVFRVGEPAPNLLSRAFARENQETTFFVLGLAATALGGAFGLWRIERRRGLLRRELAAVQAAYARTHAEPQACEAVLTERKARAAGLLADGRLDEGQFAVLKARIEELAAELRLSALDERFHYLPYGMVQALREMLSDGRITRWEREHFLLALERDTLLTAEQKEQVRRLVDGWFRKDAGGDRVDDAAVEGRP